MVHIFKNPFKNNTGEVVFFNMDEKKDLKCTAMILLSGRDGRWNKDIKCHQC